MTPKAAQDAGIGFVHQELSLCSHLKVSENIFMGRLPRKGMKLTDARVRCMRMPNAICRNSMRILSRTTFVKDLTVAQQQIIEIAKALALDCKLLILDEPTSSITEAGNGGAVPDIKGNQGAGESILYISHRMEEVFDVRFDHCHAGLAAL